MKDAWNALGGKGADFEAHSARSYEFGATRFMAQDHQNNRRKE